MLISSGMPETSADSLLDALRAGKTEQANNHLESLLDEVIENQKKVPGPLRTRLIDLGMGVVGGVAAGYLKDLIDDYRKPLDVLAPPSAPTVLHCTQKYRIFAEWKGAKLDAKTKATLPHLIDTLLKCAKRRSNHDIGAAVFLDGAAMCFDAQGKHARAERLRRQALEIVGWARGPRDESTAAACSNLALCLFAQNKFLEAKECFVRSFQIAIELDEKNLTRNAIILDMTQYAIAVDHRSLPPELKNILPDIQEIANYYLYLKILFLYIFAAVDLCQMILEK